MNPLAPYMLWIKLAGCFALVGLGWYLGSRSEATAHAETKTAHANVMTEIARKAQRAAELAREAETAVRLQEHQWAEDLATIAAQFEDEKGRVADETKQSVLADIRAGRLRVRLPSYSGVSAASQDSTGPGVDHGETGSREENEIAVAIAESIGIAAEADTRLAACQAAHTALRGPR